MCWRGGSRRPRSALPGGVPGDLVRAAASCDESVCGDSQRRPAGVCRRRPCPFAAVGRRCARQRGDAAGAARTGARPRCVRGAVPAPPRRRHRDDRSQRAPRQRRGRPRLHAARVRARRRVRRGDARRALELRPPAATRSDRLLVTRRRRGGAILCLSGGRSGAPVAGRRRRRARRPGGRARRGSRSS